MAAETFDQRFKRLTGDMLMLDICRILGIEIRELMRIRQGVRVNLSMDKLRKLCMDQGLDFASFTRDIAAPWSSEIRTEPVAEKSAGTARAKSDAASDAAKQLFREDGSRVVEPTAGTARAPKSTAASNVATGERPRRLSELPIVSDLSSLDKSQSDGIQIGHSVVGRIRAAMASAAALLGTETIPQRGDDLIVESQHGAVGVDVFNYPEPDKAGWAGDNNAVQTILGEVAGLRREVKLLSTRIDELIGR